jgi:hypothetical protein
MTSAPDAFGPGQESSDSGRPQQDICLRRRTFFGLTGIAGSTVLGATGAVAPASTMAAAGAAHVAEHAQLLTDQQRDMILVLARCLAVFPFQFPSLGEPGPARARAVAARLLAAEQRLTLSRAALVRTGANQLINAGLLTQDQPTLVAMIGQQGRAYLRATAKQRVATDIRASARQRAAAGPRIIDSPQIAIGLRGAARRPTVVPAAQSGLIAAVALAVATISQRFSPESNVIAAAWISGLGRMHQRGVLQRAARRLEA